MIRREIFRILFLILALTLLPALALSGSLLVTIIAFNVIAIYRLLFSFPLKFTKISHLILSHSLTFTFYLLYSPSPFYSILSPSCIVFFNWIHLLALLSLLLLPLLSSLSSLSLVICPHLLSARFSYSYLVFCCRLHLLFFSLSYFSCLFLSSLSLAYPFASSITFSFFCLLSYFCYRPPPLLLLLFFLSHLLSVSSSTSSSSRLIFSSLDFFPPSFTLVFIHGLSYSLVVLGPFCSSCC